MRVLLAALLLSACAAVPRATGPVRLGSALWQEDEAILALAVSPDGALLATGNAAGGVHLRDARTGVVLREFADPDLAVRALAFSPDGTLLAAAGEDGHLVIRRVEGGGTTADVPGNPDLSSPFAALAFSPDGGTLAVGNVAESVRFLDLATGVVKPGGDPSVFGVASLAWSADGANVVCGSSDGSVKVLDVAAGKVLRTHKDPRPDWLPWMTAVAFADGGRAVVAVRVNGLVDRWGEDGSGGRTVDEPETRFPGGALSPKGDLLIVAARDGALRRIDPATGKEIGRLAVSKRALLAVAFRPDGSVIVAGEDGAIRTVDPAAGTILAGPIGHLGPAVCVAASPDGRRVATGGRDGTARLWDAATGRETALLCSTAGPVYAVAFSADGRTVAAGGWDGFLRTFDAATGAPVGEPEDLGAEVRAIHGGHADPGPWRILEDGTVGTMGR